MQIWRNNVLLFLQASKSKMDSDCSVYLFLIVDKRHYSHGFPHLMGLVARDPYAHPNCVVTYKKATEYPA